MKSKIPIVTYAEASHNHGCQTKMVLGYTCGANISHLITDEEFDEVKRRVIHDFAFIGLTEEFDASVLLFHKQFGPSDPRATQFERVHMRENIFNPPERKVNLHKQLITHGYRDKFDGDLYDLVSAIFYARCHYYNITTKRKNKAGKKYK